MLSGIEIVQTAEQNTPLVALRAIDFAGQIALQLGATVFVSDGFGTGSTFLERGKQALVSSPELSAAESITQWLSLKPGRIRLHASVDGLSCVPDGQSAVFLQTSKHESEATLFAKSGLAHLLGDPARAPLIPEGAFAAGTTGYALVAAICAVVAKWRRFGMSDVAYVNAAGVLGWINWKAAMAGYLGRDLHREGEQAEWPVIACADGHVALVYTEREWQAMVEMIGDDRLLDQKFNHFKDRQKNRDAYMAPIREWAAKLTKLELVDLFEQYQIPAAPVMTAEDLLKDPLLVHRQAFVDNYLDDGDCRESVFCRSPVLPHRVISKSNIASPDRKIEGDENLPLSGMRVLDLGIITAGAGVSGLLADLGAEVLKIESETYPDPFRVWAGDDSSPFFMGNNRNKYGLALDLKTEAGKLQFLDLVKTADVVVENFRRGVIERLGLGYDVLSCVNPDIILASISGQGLDGPGSTTATFGSTLEASSGFSAKLRYDDGVPWITGRNVNYPDQTVVLYAAAVVTAALSCESRGMQLDISQRDVAVFISGEEIEAVSTNRELRQPNGRAYRTADHKWVLFDDTGQLPAAVSKPGFGLASWAGSLESSQLIAQLELIGVGAAVEMTGSEMCKANLDSGDQLFTFSPNGGLVKGFPFRLLNTDMSITLNSPLVGEHTKQFVADI